MINNQTKKSQILTLYLSGKKPAEIAREVGVYKSYVSRVLKDVRRREKFEEKFVSLLAEYISSFVEERTQDFAFSLAKQILPKILQQLDSSIISSITQGITSSITQHLDDTENMEDKGNSEGITSSITQSITEGITLYSNDAESMESKDNSKGITPSITEGITPSITDTDKDIGNIENKSNSESITPSITSSITDEENQQKEGNMGYFSEQWKQFVNLVFKPDENEEKARIRKRILELNKMLLRVPDEEKEPIREQIRQLQNSLSSIHIEDKGNNNTKTKSKENSNSSFIYMNENVGNVIVKEEKKKKKDEEKERRARDAFWLRMKFYETAGLQPTEMGKKAEMKLLYDLLKDFSREEIWEAMEEYISSEKKQFTNIFSFVKARYIYILPREKKEKIKKLLEKINTSFGWQYTEKGIRGYLLDIVDKYSDEDIEKAIQGYKMKIVDDYRKLGQKVPVNFNIQSFLSRFEDWMNYKPVSELSKVADNIYWEVLQKSMM